MKGSLGQGMASPTGVVQGLGREDSSAGLAWGLFRRALMGTTMSSHSCISCLGRGPVTWHQQLVGPTFPEKFIIIIIGYKRMNLCVNNC